MNQKKMQIQNKAITISTKSFSNQVKLRSGRKLHKYIFLNFKPVLIKHIWLPGQQFSPFSICGVSFLKFSYSDSLNHFPSLISPFRPPVSANRASRRRGGARGAVLPCQWWISDISCTACSRAALSPDWLFLRSSHTAHSWSSTSTVLKGSLQKEKRRRQHKQCEQLKHVVLPLTWDDKL